MAPRLQLHDILKAMTENVYFQPPTSIEMLRPCILYERSYGDTNFADNYPYLFTLRYMITVIDENPDSELIAKIAALPRCVFDRHFIADNLHHDVFRIYF